MYSRLQEQGYTDFLVTQMHRPGSGSRYFLEPTILYSTVRSMLFKKSILPCMAAGSENITASICCCYCLLFLKAIAIATAGQREENTENLHQNAIAATYYEYIGFGIA